MGRNRQPVPMIEPICIECRKLAVLVTGQAIYPHRPDLHDRPYYRCECGAYVGCHPGTEVPLGYPAGPLTRKARGEAHAVFDPLWKRKAVRDKISRGKARGAGYKWLADQIGIPYADCHISMMDSATCSRVVLACTTRGKT